MTRVVCCELAPVLGDLEGNIERSVAAVRAAVAAGADVVVLPELVTTGYPYESVEQARSLAVTASHPVFEQWAEAGDGRVVVAGFGELDADGVVRNSAVVVDGSGIRALYRKTHLWDTEELFFTPGDDAPPVVDTAVGRVAVMVCYDMEFPEMTRGVALRGADLLAVPTNWPWIDRPDGERAPEVVIAMAAARVNRMAVACCDRRGNPGGPRWNEETTVVAADGWPVATADEDGFAVADLDLAESRDKAISERNDVHADRRPDVYG